MSVNVSTPHIAVYDDCTSLWVPASKPEIVHKIHEQLRDHEGFSLYEWFRWQKNLEDAFNNPENYTAVEARYAKDNYLLDQIWPCEDLTY